MAKEFYDKYDIMNIFDCGVDRAFAIIRSIKAFTGDMLHLKGKVLVTEYEAWKNAVLQPKQKSPLEGEASKGL